MTATSSLGRCTLLVLPIIIVPIAFLATGPWLKTAAGPVVTLVVGGAAALFVVAYANYLAFLARRRQDEVQRASTGFAAQWGVAAGQAAFVLLLVVPPFLDFATDTVRDWANDPGANRQAIALAMTFGFCVLVLLQGIGSLVMRAIWWRSQR